METPIRAEDDVAQACQPFSGEGAQQQIEQEPPGPGPEKFPGALAQLQEPQVGLDLGVDVRRRGELDRLEALAGGQEGVRPLFPEKIGDHRPALEPRLHLPETEGSGPLVGRALAASLSFVLLAGHRGASDQDPVELLLGPLEKGAELVLSLPRKAGVLELDLEGGDPALHLFFFGREGWAVRPRRIIALRTGRARTRSPKPGQVFRPFRVEKGFLQVTAGRLPRVPVEKEPDRLLESDHLVLEEVDPVDPLRDVRKPPLHEVDRSFVI